MNITLTTFCKEKKESISSDILKKNLHVDYLKTVISSKPAFITIDGGLPLKVDETNFVIKNIYLPLGWYRGLLTEYFYKEKNIYIYCIEFYDDDSCLLVDDRINKAFLPNKRILYAISNFYLDEIKKMIDMKGVEDVKAEYKYEEKIIEYRG